MSVIRMSREIFLILFLLLFQGSPQTFILQQACIDDPSGQIHSASGTHSKKNYGIIWEFFPPFWEPLIRKKKLSFILHFRPLGTFLVFTKKLKFCHFCYIYFWEQVTPPPHTSQIPKTLFFPPEMNEIWHAKKHLVNLQKFWELGRPPPPPYGKNSQKIPQFFFRERTLKGIGVCRNNILSFMKHVFNQINFEFSFYSNNSFLCLDQLFFYR